MKKLLLMINENKKLLYTLSVLLVLITMTGGLAVASIISKQSGIDSAGTTAQPLKTIQVLGTVNISWQTVISEAGGVVKQVYVEEGNAVKGGQVLAVIENLELASQLYKAQAALEVAKARRSQLIDGNSTAKITVLEAKVRQTQHALASFLEATDEIRSLVSKVKLDQAALNEEASEEIRRLEKILSEHKQHQADPQNGSNIEHSGHHPQDGSTVTSDGKMGEECAVLLQHLQEIHGIISSLQLDQQKQAVINGKEIKINLEVTFRQLEKQLTELKHQTELAKEKVKEAEAELAEAKAGPPQVDQELAHALVKQAEVDLELAKINLEKTKVIVPFPGYITEVKVKPGEIVMSGAQLFELEKPYEAWLDIYIPKDDVETLTRGQKVEFTVVGEPDQLFTGNLHSFQLQVNNDKKLFKTSSVFYKAKVKANNAKGILKEGMEVNYIMI